MNKEDFQKLKIELLKTIRGRTSQNRLSIKLKFTFNQVSRWENGTRQLLWPDFVKICKTCNVDLSGALKRVFIYHKSVDNYSSLISHLTSDKNITEIAKTIKISRFTIRRWLEGISSPSFEEVMMLIDYFHASVIEFIDDLVGAEKINILKKEYNTIKKIKEFIFKYPFAPAVVLCLQLEEYKNLSTHKKKYISNKINITEEEEDKVLGGLLDLGVIGKDGNKYTILRENHLNLKNSFKESTLIKRYWIKRADKKLQKMDSPTLEDKFSYLLFNANKEQLKIIHEKYVDFYVSVLEMVQKNDTPSNNAMVMNLQIFKLD